MDFYQHKPKASGLTITDIPWCFYSLTSSYSHTVPVIGPHVSTTHFEEINFRKLKGEAGLWKEPKKLSEDTNSAICLSVFMSVWLESGLNVNKGSVFVWSKVHSAVLLGLVLADSSGQHLTVIPSEECWPFIHSVQCVDYLMPYQRLCEPDTTSDKTFLWEEYEMR